MKALLKNGFAIAALLCLLLSACNSEQPNPQTPQQEPGEVFRTIYRFPVAGTSSISGEADILNATAIQQENSKMASVLARILEDVKSQKLIPTPIDEFGEVKEYGDDYAVKMIESVSSMDGYSDLALLRGFEVDYKGTAHEGQTTWETTFFRMVYIDPNQVLPDRNMFQLAPAQLTNYRLGDNNEGQPLVAYLNQKALEGYPIMVESPVDTIRFRSFDQAVHFHALMEAGDVEHMVENPS